MAVPFNYDLHLEVYQHPKSLILTLPLPISVNEAYAPNPNGRGIRSTPALTDYKNSIGTLLRGRVERLNDPDSPYAFHKSFLLEADILFCMSNASDVDNRVKPLFDALEFADIFYNDKCIQRVTGIEAMTPHKEVPYHVNITLSISRDTKRKVCYPWWEVD